MNRTGIENTVSTAMTSSALMLAGMYIHPIFYVLGSIGLILAVSWGVWWVLRRNS